MFRRPPKWGAALFATAVLIAACSDASGGAQPESHAEFTLGLVNGASDYQVAILEDGVVTASEYERSILDTLQCIRQNGVDAVGPELDPVTGQFTYLVRASETGATNERIAASCVAEHSDLVERAFLYSVPIASESEREQLIDATVACLADLGYDISRAPTDSELDAVLLSGDDNAIACLNIENHR